MWPADLSRRAALVQTVERLAALDSQTRPHAALARSVMELLASEEPDRTLAEPPYVNTLLTIDRTPIEVSLKVASDKRELRYVTEINAGAPYQQMWTSGERIVERLATDYGAHLDVFAKVVDVFKSSSLGSGVAIGTLVPTSERAYFKAYFRSDRASVARALARLDLEQLADSILTQLTTEKACALSLDLIPGREARVKIYVQHVEYDADKIEPMVSLGPNWRRGKLSELMTQLYRATVTSPSGIAAGPYCTYHIRGSRIEGVTAHLPCYPMEFDLPNDELVSDGQFQERISTILKSNGIDDALYNAFIREFADDDLNEDYGLHSYLGLQFDTKGAPCFTVYSNPRFYAQRFGFYYGMPGLVAAESQG